MVVGRDPLAACRRRRRPPRARCPRRAARGRPRRASGRPRPTRRRRSARSGVLPDCSTPVHCLPSSSAIPFLRNAFASSFGGVVVLLRDQAVEHLDDRDLAPERAEDRGELAADDPAAEDRRAAPAPRSARAGRSSRRRASESRPGIGGRIGNEPVATIAEVNVDVLAALDRDRVRVPERPLALHPLDAVRLEERGDAARHLRDDARPSTRSPPAKSSSGSPTETPSLRERVARLVQEVRGLHPRLRRDAADAQAGAAELGLLLDADDVRAELRGADRGGVPAGPATENCDVALHRRPMRIAGQNAAAAHEARGNPPRDVHHGRRAGERRVLRGHARAAARQEDGQPGRPDRLPPLLRRRARQRRRRHHVLRVPGRAARPRRGRDGAPDRLPRRLRGGARLLGRARRRGAQLRVGR